MNLDKLFDTIDVDEAILNPFEAFQYTSAYDEFRNQYIEPLYEVSMEKGNEAFLLLGSVCKELKRIAFKVGYKTAIRLFTEGLTE